MRDNKKGLFSVVVPTYNRAELVSATLSSIYAQTYRPIELIIVDNGSTDTTFETIQRWGESHQRPDFTIRIYNEERRGADFARNRGFHEVRSECMMFFDSDDIMHPNLVEKAMAEFSRDPELDLVVWPINIRKLDGSSKVSHVWASRPLECQMIHGMMCTICYALRRRLTERSGIWDTTLPHWNDWELGMRILLSSPKSVYLDLPLADHISQAESITGTNFHSRAGKWEKSIDTIEKDIKSMADVNVKDSLLRMAAYRRVILAAHYSREGYPELAHPLMLQVRNNPAINKLQYAALTFAYHWTRLGIRGAWIIVRAFFRAHRA